MLLACSMCCTSNGEVAHAKEGCSEGICPSSFIQKRSELGRVENGEGSDEELREETDAGKDRATLEDNMVKLENNLVSGQDCPCTYNLKFPCHIGNGSCSSRINKAGCEANGGQFCVAKCAALSLENVKMDEICSSLGIGESCEVSCPDGFIGESVRYYCFSALATKNKPPAGLRPPVCFNATGALFEQGKEMAFVWDDKGCLKCDAAKQQCSLVANAHEEDTTCTIFQMDPANKHITWSKDHRQCMDIFGGPHPGLWKCDDVSNENQDWEEEPSDLWPGAKQLCAESQRGRICLHPVGMPTRFFDSPIDVSLLKPSFEDLMTGKDQLFLSKSYDLQLCRAKLESTVPDDFWPWLKNQDFELVQALFATFPVHPGQVKMLHDIREAVGHAKFDEVGMASFAVALAYVNRMKKSIDEAIQMPHPSFEFNKAGYLRHEMERIKQEMIDGQHCSIQSNECNNLHKCCGKPEEWKFTWPRDPSPSVKEWVQFWLKSVEDHSQSLWVNPLKNVPWMYAVYVFPSPIEECEWVHSKLIDDEPMEGKWYLYDSSFHERICAGGKYHPDSLPGIAVYGGVCGRMSTLDYRKTGCMGMPATAKNEPGHAAGFRLKPQTAIFTELNIITDVRQIKTLNVIPEKHDYVTLELAMGDEAFPGESTTCLQCKTRRTLCEVLPASSEQCSHFTVDRDSKRLRALSDNQCISIDPGPKATLWNCAGDVDANQDFTPGEDGDLVYESARGKFRIRTFAVPQEPYVAECLVCKEGWANCERAVPNSTDCTQFLLEETGVLKVPAIGQCLDMFRGPTPGLWKCSDTAPGGVPTYIVEGGYRRMTTKHGQMTYESLSPASDKSELGRCLVCSNANQECGYSVAGAKDCTVFQYVPKTKLIEVGWGNQCFDQRQGSKPGLHGCDASASNENQIAHVDEEGRLVVKSGRGTLHLHVPNKGTLPDVQTRWQYIGVTELSCTKANCNFPSLMDLDSKSMFSWRHKEVALAALESFNNYEHHGIYPTAHDEARLAASMVFALHKEASASDEELAPLLAWALQRNPALWEAWELAADFPAGSPFNDSSMPSRDALASREWYKTLSLLRIDSTDARGQAAADKFAREHLMKKDPWVQLPQLHRNLVGRLCGALSDGILKELGEVSAECVLVRQLAAGHGWDEAEDAMREADVVGPGNLPSKAFQMHWEAMARLAVAPNKHKYAEQLKNAIENLLGDLTVGYINERSQTFFVEHHRVLLRSPYAHVLQLSAVVLSEQRRLEILERTKKILQQPGEMPQSLWSSRKGLVETFLEWLGGHVTMNSKVFDESSTIDELNGKSSDDMPNPAVYDELELDRDARVELGAVFWHETENSERRYDAEKLLKNLLRLDGPGVDSPEASQEDEGLSATAVAAGTKDAMLLQARGHRAAEVPTASELVQMCMDDLV